MKTFSFQTCKGLLKIVAAERDEAVAIFKILVRKYRSGYKPVGQKKLRTFAKMLNQPLCNIHS